MITAARLAWRIEVLICVLVGAIVWLILTSNPAFINSKWLAEKTPLQRADLLYPFAAAATAWSIYGAHLARHLATRIANRSLPPRFLRFRDAKSGGRSGLFGPPPPMRGRGDELRVLEDFIRDGGILAWWWLIGAGGLGKTRLAAEWTERLRVNEGLDAGFWHGNVEDLENWRPRRATVIVVDDAGVAGKHIVGRLLEQHERDPYPHPVRVLLIDRDKPMMEIGSTVPADRHYLFRPEPLELRPLPESDAATLFNDVVDHAANAVLKPGDRNTLLELSKGNPFWLMLAARHATKATRSARSSTEQLLAETIETLVAKWTQLYSVPPECFAGCYLIAIAGHFPNVQLTKSSDSLRALFAGGEMYYRRMGVLSGAEFFFPFHDLLREFWILEYADWAATGRVTQTITIEDLIKAAYAVNFDEACRVLAQAWADFPLHKMRNIALPSEIGVAGSIEELAWLRVRAHILGRKDVSSDAKTQILGQIQQVSTTAEGVGRVAVDEHLAWALANTALSYATTFLTEKRARRHVESLHDAISRIRDATERVERLYRTSAVNDNIAISYGRILLANVWIASNLSDRSKQLVAEFLNRLSILASDYVTTEKSYSQALLTAVYNRIGPALPHLSELRRLVGRNERCVDDYAKAIAATVSDPSTGTRQSHIDALFTLTQSHATVLHVYAAALGRELTADPTVATIYEEQLRRLAARSPELSAIYAKHLVAGVNARTPNSLRYLQSLRELARQYRSLRLAYAKGLVGAISNRVGSVRGNLRALKRIATTESDALEWYAEGLRCSLHSDPSRFMRIVRLRRLRKLAKRSDALRSVYDRAIEQMTPS